jgi:hypothetical protein
MCYNNNWLRVQLKLKIHTVQKQVSSYYYFALQEGLPVLTHSPGTAMCRCGYVRNAFIS